MRTFCSLCLCAGKVGVALVVVLGAYLAAAHELRLSPWDLARCSAEMAAARRRDKELEVIHRHVDARLAGKFRVMADVQAGRLGLLEAAARFRDLNDADPTFDWDLYRAQLPGATDAERHCRNVIEFVDDPTDVHPGQDEVVGRLQAELAEHLRDGTLALREPRQPFTGWPPEPAAAPQPPAGGGPGPTGPPPSPAGKPAPRRAAEARCE
jgi:hypothetical protein